MTFLLFLIFASAGLSFTHFGVEQGLSQGTVVSICQDSRGFMWFSSNNGLNMYDGSRVTVFRHDAADQGSIADNLIQKVFSDDSGRLWACTGKGLSMYDPRKESFVNHFLPDSSALNDICRIDDSRMLVATNSDLYVFNTPTSSFSPPVGGKAIGPCAIFYTPECIYVATLSRKVFRFDPSSLSCEVELPFKIPFPVICFLRKSPTELWMGTEGGGLYLYDSVSRSLSGHFSHSDGILSSDRVRNLCYAPDGRLWIGTRDGLDILDEADGTFLHVHSDPRSLTALSYESVKAVYRDCQGGMWLGTYFGGINYWHPARNRFEVHTGLTADDIVGCIAMGPSGELWVGTNSGGVALIDIAHGNVSHPVPSGVLGSDDIKSISFTSDGRKALLGAHGGGLSVYDLSNGKMSALLDDRDVYDILRLEDNSFVVGTLSGVYAVDPSAVRCRKIKGVASPFRIYTVVRDHNGTFWTGGKDGTKMYSSNESGDWEECSDPELLSLRQTICFHESGDSLMWIGTMDGLHCFDFRTRRLIPPVPSFVLNGKSALSIGEDSKGLLWIGSDDGLYRFNPSSGEVRVYSGSDGLPVGQFYNNSFCPFPDGSMFFGTTGGLVHFNPAFLDDSTPPTPALVTGLLVFNKTVRPGDESGILSSSIIGTEEIVLKHDQNTIAFRFGVPDYASTGSHHFAYKMEGIDKDWILTSDYTSSTYSRLQRGTYRFLVRASNCDGEWSENPSALCVRVLPVWYKSIAATICWIAVLLVVASVALKKILHQKDIENKLVIERLNAEHEEKVNKLRALAYSDKPSLSHSDEKFLIDAISIVEKNFSNPSFGVEEFAREMSMSRSNLHLRLRKTAGESPVDLIRKFRFNEACHLLREKKLNVAEISYRTGFGSPSYFTTSFKKQFGIRPSDFS